jgi:hypothetical protein
MNFGMKALQAFNSQRCYEPLLCWKTQDLLRAFQAIEKVHTVEDCI